MAYRIRLVLSICIYIYVCQCYFSLLYLISSVGILCLHSMTSLAQGHSLTFHNYSWSKPQLYSFLDNTVFSPNSCLSYKKAILVHVSEAVPTAIWLPLTLLKSTCSSLHYNQWYGTWHKGVFMSCAMMQNKQRYNSVYDMLMN